ncbi:hypothetical protein M378DRAFT_169447, partial [Amanita muscaria Koide BX008]
AYPRWQSVVVRHPEWIPKSRFRRDSRPSPVLARIPTDDALCHHAIRHSFGSSSLEKTKLGMLIETSAREEGCLYQALRAPLARYEREGGILCESHHDTCHQNDVDTPSKMLARTRCISSE